MTVRIIQGDCIDVMRRLPADSVDCIVTSPPYWGLRDYGVDGQIGLEQSLGEHLDKMVEVFRHCRRLLKPTGTLWLNYGDCYASKPNGRKAKDITGDDRTFRDKPFSTVGAIHRGKRIERGAGRWGGGNLPASGILKPKDLCMIPNRLAIALQEDGWWVRSEIIWGKPNPMPDSVRDRPGIAHEKIFLLSKSQRYFYDDEAVRFSLRPKTLTSYGTRRAETGDDGSGRVKKQNMAKSMPMRKPRGHERTHGGFTARWDQMTKAEQQANGRNLRNYEPPPMQVWEIATKPFKEAHFATFPPELAERCIKAGCPAGGVVFDPFGGSGTTGLVADALGLNALMIELNPEYIDIARARLRKGLRKAKR